MIVGGGTYDFAQKSVTEKNENIVTFKIKRTNNPSKPLTFLQKNERSWLSNLAPYVQALEDKIIIAQGGVVRKIC